MSTIQRNITSEIRNNLGLDELWRSEDQGIINAWELGRLEGEKNTDIRLRAQKDELMSLLFKGGFDEKLKNPFKYGSLHYLAMWLGLRNENLIIDINAEYTLCCSRFNHVVMYTSDIDKILKPNITSSDLKLIDQELIKQALKSN